MERSYVKTVFVLVILLFLSGCITKPSDTAEIDHQTKNKRVIAAPLSLFITAGDTQQYTYRNHTLQIHYLSAAPQHNLTVMVDDTAENLTLPLELTCVGNHCQYHQVIGGLDFVIEPVTRTDDTWSAHTWGVDELYIEITT
jgi:hypothetical protein